ncbi:hypothetical protein H257_11556 [Aphanomyces astaci]|uniref:DDE-1 domain-containing protein n=1 Tax=Aphanomyces astaci TaxID=112090 RepID=W4G4L6_APHAT|nr:hypothetical protein H257_11556 [Aphanomyces astaci]ETV73898.1 hypothetical protein H257_11556 [Aphanomyces astaci]|eukprot:XP_009836834.1 hypothetical protein H257_11556 [Aphanomyces astaci]
MVELAAKQDAILESKANKKRLSLGGQGRHELMPFAKDLNAFMNEVHDQEHHLTHTHLITYMKTHHQHWLTDNLSAKKTEDRAYHIKQGELREIHDKFASDFWAKFASTAHADIIYVDETSVYYDMPPGKTIAKVGGSSKVDRSQKHSNQMTAVISIRWNGDKLPILFVLKGKPGGDIER